jgi:hypothetical protein
VEAAKHEQRVALDGGKDEGHCGVYLHWQVICLSHVIVVWLV